MSSTVVAPTPTTAAQSLRAFIDRVQSDRLRTCIALSVVIINAVVKAAIAYATDLVLRKHVELGAWVAIVIILAVNVFRPPPIDPALAEAVTRMGPTYAYMGPIADVLNPIWVYGAYSKLMHKVVDMIETRPLDLVFSQLITRIEDAPRKLLGDTESHVHELGRGFISSTVPTVTLPLYAAQLAHATMRLTNPPPPPPPPPPS